MQDKKGVMAAVLAAVEAFLEEEAAAAAPAVPPPRPAAAISLWAASGRQEMMTMRTLWQRRMPLR